MTVKTQLWIKVKDLCDKYPETVFKFNNCNFRQSVDDVIDRLDRNNITDFDFEKLNEFYLNKELSTLIYFLPKSTVLNEFGEDVLLWAICNSPRTEFDDSLEEFCNLTNRDKGLLFRATKWSDNIATILSAYNFFIDLPKVLPNIPFQDLLKSNVKNEINFSEKRAKDYFLTIMITQKNNVGHEITWGFKKVGDKDFGVYLEAPVGLALMYKNLPNAILSFSPSNPERILIRQIQGVNPRSLIDRELICARGLFPLNWQKLLVQCAEYVASEIGFKEIEIRSAYNSHWVNHQEELLARAKRNYDETAKNLEYTLEPNKEDRREKGNWCKTIN